MAEKSMTYHCCDCCGDNDLSLRSSPARISSPLIALTLFAGYSSTSDPGGQYDRYETKVELCGRCIGEMLEEWADCEDVSEGKRTVSPWAYRAHERGIANAVSVWIDDKRQRLEKSRV